MIQIVLEWINNKCRSESSGWCSAAQCFGAVEPTAERMFDNECGATQETYGTGSSCSAASCTSCKVPAAYTDPRG